MKILMTGATGFIGSKVAEKLILEGHDLVCLTRSKQSANDRLNLPVTFVEWDSLDSQDELLKGIQGVIHLAGENVGEKRWSAEQKQRILSSRKEFSQKLVNFINKRANQCQFVVSASAIGYYPDSQKDEWINEQTGPDSHFLAQVCQQWEEAMGQIDHSIKNCILRIGVVLGSEGGMLKKLLPLYRKGLGGKVSHGNQWMSWIHVHDLVEMILFSMKKQLNATYNAVAPTPIQNKAFNKLLAKHTQRPAFFSVPAFMLKLIMGDAAYLALSSQRIESKKIQDEGFEFKYPEMDSALKEICNHEVLPPVKRANFHHLFRRCQFVDKPVEEVFEFFKEAKNLENITPKFLNFKVKEQSTPQIEEGTKFKYQLKLHGLPISWTTIITEWSENSRFVDYQKTGPYQIWYHRHIFIPVKGGTLMVDEVRFRLPFGFIGEFFGLPFVKKDVENIFNYRKKVIGELL
jgi:uncharacterized protein (TIGR01777 family)